MAIKSYLLTANYQAPYLLYTGMAHAPQKLKYKQFLKNDIVKGELKHSFNKPIGVIVNGGLYFPLQVLREVVTKEIVSDASGEGSLQSKIKANLISTDPKVQYIDFAIIGIIAGVGIVYLLEKYDIIASNGKINYLIGAGIGSGASTYMKWRAITIKKNKPKE